MARSRRNPIGKFGVVSVPPGTAPEKLLDVKGAASWLGVSRTKVFELMRDEGLPVIRMSGRMIRFDTNSLYQWALTRQTNYVFIA
ncbi:helix-turn-helix transcriptional regulator [Tengunoibacter tsumagoiensis]|uniref:Uncharacterized protein n=1 Tax=Tengunoibacter tsumagoiensis TaxID=2014871 RepID=A0A402A877_9CHLR|nr:helix-turn-helix domain-containing protein [Tengunoibacter tsumagoiensis]GCE15299.1 hypothetical protein KTT_51580 [Tengunoibacter tsumagoiensis]